MSNLHGGGLQVRFAPCVFSQRFISICVACAWQATSCSDEDGETQVLKNTKKYEWTSHSRSTRFRLNMEEKSQPWTPTHALSGLDKGRKARCLDVIDVGYWSYLVANPEAESRSPHPEYFVDCSQGVERRPWGPTLPCINQDSIPYSFELDRVLSLQDRSRSTATQTLVFTIFCCGPNLLPRATIQFCGVSLPSSMA